jgi:hypothetical protein
VTDSGSFVGYFPVYIEGANLSLGDLHFAQGDGELSFCGAIEMVILWLRKGLKLVGWYCHSEDVHHQGWCDETWLEAANLYCESASPLRGCITAPYSWHYLTILQPSPIDPMYKEQVIFEGLSVGELLYHERCRQK